MDDLPELPFEKVLSYLGLEDRLKARAVSRRWYHKINNFKVKSLCYSDRPSGFIYGKNQLISGAFAQNFIHSIRFSSFFSTFGPTILSNLKHLRLCDLCLSAENRAAFAQTLNSLGLLEELDIIRFDEACSKSKIKLKLNLPMLTSIHLNQVNGIKKLALDVPRLKRVKLLHCSSSLRLELVHAHSVKWLATCSLAHLAAKNLNSLEYLYLGHFSKISATLLSSLEQLKEVHTLKRVEVSKLFEQKQRYGRAGLKIFLYGLLLNGPDDSAIGPLTSEAREVRFRYLAENPSRLADKILHFWTAPYAEIERIIPGSEIHLLNRFIGLEGIKVSKPVQDIQRFLTFLKKNSDRTVALEFSGDHPQELFDRLPEHCAVESLEIHQVVPDFGFLLRLEHLIELYLKCSFDIELVEQVVQELRFLSLISFKYFNKQVMIAIDYPKRFEVSFDLKETSVADLNAAIEFIVDNIAE